MKTVRDGGTLAVLNHPLRLQILEALRESGSAASVARLIGAPRQKVNYHLKELHRHGLVHEVGERRVGNLTETLFRSVAGAFVVAPEAIWGGPTRAEAVRSQISLEQLLSAGEQLQQDAVALLDRAAFDDEEIASAAVTVDVAFRDEAARASFLREYLAAVQELTERHSVTAGEPYRVVFAAHPVVEGSDS